MTSYTARNYKLLFEQEEDGIVVKRSTELLTDDLMWAWKNFIRNKSVVNDEFTILEINGRKVDY
tara:strand:+ start:1317 stop:1508 length:192 start_codon:yes stop_codon:yes gene_type:complete